MFFEVDEELRVAIEFEALKRGVKTTSELIQTILREQLHDSLKEAKKIIQQRKNDK